MKHILVVEDDLLIQKVYEEKLPKDICQIHRAATYEVAMKILSEQPIDLILLDIILPGGKNGFDILEEIKRNPSYNTIPVIILTNLDTEEKTAKKMGAENFFIKGNTPIQVIIDTVKKTLGV